MKKSIARFGSLVMAAMLAAGCATDMGGAASGMSVTRFHLGQPIARGEIVVEPADRSEAGSLEFAQLAEPVERELTRLGWNVTRSNARSEQVAVVGVEQGSREARSRSGLSIGVGGGTGGWRGGGVGLGVGGTIPLGGSGPIIMTELHVRIQRRSDATVTWEGRAQTEARIGTPFSDARVATDRLATALFGDFPGESGRTIRVR
jgi:hypothetical protein